MLVHVVIEMSRFVMELFYYKTKDAFELENFSQSFFLDVHPGGCHPDMFGPLSPPRMLVTFGLVFQGTTNAEHGLLVFPTLPCSGSAPCPGQVVS